eukprot:scaffold318483_cov24-Attheya_sp.AAC.1
MESAKAIDPNRYSMGSYVVLLFFDPFDLVHFIADLSFCFDPLVVNVQNDMDVTISVAGIRVCHVGLSECDGRLP